MGPATLKNLSERPFDAVAAESSARALLRIASYNVHGCIGLDWRRNVSRVARVIQELGCDTVGLQEVGGKHDRTGAMQLELLARETGMQAIAGGTIIRHEYHYGNALLTTRPVLAVRQHDLSYRKYEPRGALDVDLDVGGVSVRVFITHLGLKAIERRDQVAKIIELLRDVPTEQPLVILGDMNEWLPGGLILKWLHQVMDEAPSRRSFPTWMPVLSLDRVWSRPHGSLMSFEVHRTAAARRASDHYPVKAVIAPHAPTP
jgi:endonuclease/exonuclease/phosphatase family metal-dependent hydrolase